MLLSAIEVVGGSVERHAAAAPPAAGLSASFGDGLLQVAAQTRAAHFAQAQAEPVGDVGSEPVEAPAGNDVEVTTGVEVNAEVAAAGEPTQVEYPLPPPTGVSQSRTAAPPEGFVAGESEQVRGSTTEAVFRNPDGSMTTQVFAEPALVLDEATGDWVGFDGTLVSDRGRGGRFVPTKGASEVSFAASAGAANLVELSLGKGRTVRFGMDDAADVAGVAVGSKVVYADVQPGVDLVEFALIDGVKEEVVLKVPPVEPPVFRFPLQAPGLTPRVAEDGTIELVAPGGEVAAFVPPGFGWDANAVIAEEQKRVDVETVLVGGPGSWAIELRPDWAWLSDPATIYPVTIDPTINLPTQIGSGDAYVVNNIPYGVFNGAAQWSSSMGLYVNQTGWSKPGPWPTPWNEYRSFYKFATPTLTNCSFVSASFVVDPAYQRLFAENGSWSYQSPVLFDLYRVDGGWDPNTLTWAGQPPATYLYSYYSGPDGHWAATDVSSTVAGWINGTIANNGFELGVNYWDSRYTAIVALEQGNLQPHLNVTCRPKAVPSWPAGPGGSWTGHLRPEQNLTLQWTDAAPSPSNIYWLQLCDSTAFSNCWINEQTPAGSTSFSRLVSAVRPAQNAPLYWRVFRWDEAGWDWTSAGHSTIQLNNTRPAAPQLPLVDGFVTTTTPRLQLQAPVVDVDTDSFNGIRDTVFYTFTVCSFPVPEPFPIPAPNGCVVSLETTNTFYDASINWATRYYWKVATSDHLDPQSAFATNSNVTATTPTFAPLWTTGNFPNGAPSGMVDTSSGNFHFAVTDIDPATVGVEIGVTRSYNSMDQRNGAFGLGWTFPLDMAVQREPANTGLPEQGLSVLMPDGRMEFHGRNGDGTYARAFGYSNDLTVSGGVVTLTDIAKTKYTFEDTDGIATTWELTSITTVDGHSTTVSAPGASRTVRDVASGRQLTFSYTTPPGAGRSHITSVVSDSVAAHGGPLTWTYTYAGDKLTSACSPDIDPTATVKTLCTTYRHDQPDHPSLINQIETPQLKNGSPTNRRLRVVITYTAGKVTAQRDGLLNTWSYAYDTTPANLTIPVPPGTPVAGVTWPTTAASMTTTTAPTVSGVTGVTRTYFDSQRRLIYSVDPVGAEQWFHYNEHGFNDRKAVEDVSATSVLTTVLTTDAKGRVTGRVDADGSTWAWSYNDSNKVLTETDPFSVVTTNTYDANVAGTANQGSRLLTSSRPATTHHSAAVTTYTYTNASTQALDAAAGQAPPVGLLASVQDPRGNTTTYGYNRAGDLRRVTDNVALITEYTYDELGRKIGEAINFDGTLRTVATISYDAVSRVIQVDGPAITNPITSVVRRERVVTTYDDNGNKLSVTRSDIGGSATPDPARQTSYEYDDADREVKMTDALGKVMTRTYDAAGRVASVTDQNGTLIQTEYDARGLPTKVTMIGFVDDPVTPGAPRNVVLQETGYDLLGRPVWQSNGGTAVPVTSTRYDAMGRAVETRLYTNRNAYTTTPTDPVQVLSTATYDKTRMTSRTAFGDVVSGSVVQVQRTDYQHDVYGRVTVETLRNAASNGAGGGSVDSTVTYTYDSNGNVVKRVRGDANAVAETRTRFDAANRPILEIVENGAVDIATHYQRDRRGLIVATTSPRGVTLAANDDPTLNSAYTTNTTYDLAGRATTTQTPTTDVTTTARATGATTTVSQQLRSDVGYNTFGEPVSSRDPSNQITTTAYDNGGRRSQITHPAYTTPAGSSITATEQFGYDNVGNLTSRTDRRGEITTFVFDRRNRVVAQTDPAVGANPAGVTRYTYDDLGNRTSITNQIGARTSWTYDAMNRVATETLRVRNGANPATDHTTTYTYDYPGRPITVCLPPVGAQTRCSTSTFAPFGQQLTAQTATGAVTRMTYDGLHRLTATTDPLGRRSISTYDPASRVLQSTAVSPDNALSSTERYRYDAAGNRVGLTRPEGGMYGYAYDNLNRLTTVTQPLTNGPLAWWRLNETSGTTAGDNTNNTTPGTHTGLTLGRPAAPSGGMGNTTAAGFSPAAASMVTLSDPALNIVDDLTIRAWIKSTDNGLPQMIVNRNDNVGASTFSYQLSLKADGRVSFGYSTSTGVWDAVGTTASVTRGVWTEVAAVRRNNVVELYINGVPQALRNNTNTGPSTGNLGQAQSTPTFVTRIGGRADGYQFNGDIDEVVIYDRALSASEIAAVPALKTNQPNVAYGYDANSNATRMVDGRGNTWSATYNPWNLIQDRIEPSTTAHSTIANRRFTYSYDAGGLRVRDDLPGGIRVDRVFDDLGRMTSEASVANANAPAGTRTFTYDAAGRMTTFSHPTSAATVTYDDRNLLKAITGPATVASSFAYDPAGRMTQRIDAAGTATYTWDAGDRLDTEIDPLTGQTRDYAWYADNRPQSVAYGSTAAINRAYTYDGLGRLATDTLTAPGGATLRATSYGYDRNHNLVTETATGTGTTLGTQTYTYDAADRLTSWRNTATVTTTYTWDANGNRLTNGAAASTYDQRNRILTNGTETYAWQPRGTLRTRTNPTTTNYTFDGLGRMTVAGAVTYTYDALGRVAARTQSAVTDAFSYSGLDADPTRTGTGTSSNLISHSPSGEPLAVKVGTNPALTAGEDRHGDLTTLFNPTGTALSDTIEYDPFGVPAGRTGTTANQIGFQSDYTDPTTALVNMGARWYAPTLDAFTTRDTYDGVLTTPITLNRYTYANANPIAYFDPDGNCARRIDGKYCVGNFKDPPKPKPKPRPPRDPKPPPAPKPKPRPSLPTPVPLPAGSPGCDAVLRLPCTGTPAPRPGHGPLGELTPNFNRNAGVSVCSFKGDDASDCALNPSRLADEGRITPLRPQSTDAFYEVISVSGGKRSLVEQQTFGYSWVDKAFERVKENFPVGFVSFTERQWWVITDAEVSVGAFDRRSGNVLDARSGSTTMDVLISIDLSTADPYFNVSGKYHDPTSGGNVLAPFTGGATFTGATMYPLGTTDNWLPASVPQYSAPAFITFSPLSTELHT